MAFPTTIKVRGKTYPVLDQVKLNGRSYLFLKKLGRGTTKKHLVYDRHAGRGGDLRLLYYLPRSAQQTHQYLKVLERFSRQNSILPHIYDFQNRKTECLIVTNWLEGITLREYLQQAEQNKKPWPSTYNAFTMFCRFSHAITKCHRQTMFVHGDLKPENLLLTSSSNDLTMIDFGSSWTEECSSTKSEGDGFNAAYAAPERGEQKSSQTFLDQRADYYAIHIMLYELFTGQLPFDNLGGKAGWTQFQSQAPPLIPASKQLRGEDGFTRPIWKQIDNFMNQGLQFNPKNRHASASIWLDDWNRILITIKQQEQKLPWENVAYQFLSRWF